MGGPRRARRVRVSPSSPPQVAPKGRDARSRRAPPGQSPAPKSSSPLPPQDSGTPLLGAGRALPWPALRPRALPAPPRRARGFVVVRAPAARGAGAVLPGRRVPVGPAAGARGARGRARRAGRGSASSAPPPGLANRIGSRRRERARARRVEPGGGARAAPPAAAEERGEEGEGREEAPARLPAKRPYLSGHCLSLPGGRLGAADPFPPGSASPGAAEGAGQAGARGAAGPCRPGQHLGRIPASPAPMPGSP